MNILVREVNTIVGGDVPKEIHTAKTKSNSRHLRVKDDIRIETNDGLRLITDMIAEATGRCCVNETVSNPFATLSRVSA